MESCTCEKCKGSCLKRPCWPTPRGAARIIEFGLGSRFMMDWWVADGGEEDILILVPALVGYVSEWAPSRPIGACTFYTDNGLCEIHGRLKPLEGQMVFSCLTGEDKVHGVCQKDLHEKIARTWDNDFARALTERWLAKRNLSLSGKPDTDMFSMFAML